LPETLFRTVSRGGKQLLGKGKRRRAPQERGCQEEWVVPERNVVPSSIGLQNAPPLLFKKMKKVFFRGKRGGKVNWEKNVISH